MKLPTDPDLMAAHLLALTSALNEVITSDPRLMWKVAELAQKTEDVLLPSGMTDQQIATVKMVLTSLVTPRQAG